MAHIARMADVSAAILYRWWPIKEALLLDSIWLCPGCTST
jgi:AcrR family transcriptional regulator